MDDYLNFEIQGIQVRVTHQAPLNVLACFCLLWRTDRSTPCLKIMITITSMAGACWVNFLQYYHEINICLFIFSESLWSHDARRMRTVRPHGRVGLRGFAVGCAENLGLGGRQVGSYVDRPQGRADLHRFSSLWRLLGERLGRYQFEIMGYQTERLYLHLQRPQSPGEQPEVQPWWPMDRIGWRRGSCEGK